MSYSKRVSVLHLCTQQEIVVAYLKPGDTFGELALTDPECKRKATIVCVSDCHLLILERDAYLHTIQNELDKEILPKLAFLRQVLLFEGLSDGDLVQLAQMLTTKNLASGKVVARQGNDVEDILFVLHGAVKGVRGLEIGAIRQKETCIQSTGVTTDQPSHLRRRYLSKQHFTLLLRRGALAIGLNSDIPSRFVPDLPSSNTQTAPATTKLASLLSKHRRYLTGKAPEKTSTGVFEVTMAALRATKRQRDRELLEQDIPKFKTSNVVYKQAWVFIEVFEGGKFDCIGDRGLVKASRQNMTVFTTTPTIFYAINKFEMLKKLPESSLSILNTNASPEIDDKNLVRTYKADKQWRSYKRRVAMRIIQEQTFEEEEEYYSDDAFGGTASYFDALAETDSPGGNVEIFAEGNSESSLDLSSAEINLEAVANSDQEVYGYFSTDTISESLTGLQHQFVQGASLTELEAYGKGALLREDFRGRTFVDGTNTAANQKTKPFLLQERTSYTSIGLFSIAAYPYSCKLLWSPIVDSIFLPNFGRRKSWIVPLQFSSAILLYSMAEFAEQKLMSSDILGLSLVFFLLVLLAATQDIAVDGWALTLLSKNHVGYQSTCQTVGMNAGFFLSFTVFLALNDASFCNAYIRSEPQETGLVTLASYMKLWGAIYAVVTVYIALFKTEKLDYRHGSLMDTYRELWSVIRLPALRKLSLVLLTCRLGAMAAEGAGALKLLEKGVSREALAGLVLLEFPIELFSAVFAGRWVSNANALKPFLIGYNCRLVIAALFTYWISRFPPGVGSWTEAPVDFFILGVLGVATSFIGTLIFTAQGSFFSKISDPAMGGSYLTLLNTISNLGSSLPRFFVFWMMDYFTWRQCQGEFEETLFCPSKKNDALGPNPCTNAGGSCVINIDGFYIVSYSLIGIGVLLGGFFSRSLLKLQSLPLSSWRKDKISREE
eukprot:g3948.t1